MLPTVKLYNNPWNAGEQHRVGFKCQAERIQEEG